jgi:hypothetical protein
MGYDMEIPAHQIGGHMVLWAIRGYCKGTPLMSSETSSGEPLSPVSPSAITSHLPLSASPTGITSAVLLVERTAEALPTTSDIPFYFYLFIFYYDVIPSRHLSS